MKITKQHCKDIVAYNTIGKGKGNPNFTALANAKLWLHILSVWEGTILDGFTMPDTSVAANFPSWKV